MADAHVDRKTVLNELLGIQRLRRAFYDIGGFLDPHRLVGRIGPAKDIAPLFVCALLSFRGDGCFTEVERLARFLLEFLFYLDALATAECRVLVLVGAVGEIVEKVASHLVVDAVAGVVIGVGLDQKIVG